MRVLRTLSVLTFSLLFMAATTKRLVLLVRVLHDATPIDAQWHWITARGNNPQRFSRATTLHRDTPGGGRKRQGYACAADSELQISLGAQADAYAGNGAVVASRDKREAAREEPTKLPLFSPCCQSTHLVK